jgi:hypothetical protein
MVGRWTNLAIGVLLVAAVVTGFASYAIGVDWPLDLSTLHGVLALAILLLAPWKSIIIRRGLSRGRAGNWTSLVLLGLVMVAAASGLIHATGLLQQLGPLSLMQVHVGMGLAALAVGVQHFRRHPVRPRRTDLEKRALLRGAALAAGAGALWLAWEGTARALAWPGAGRRFTGSHEKGSGRPHLLPSTSWLDDRPPPLLPETWTVEVAGRTLDLAGLAVLPQLEVEAVLDCTGGWYSVQTWGGVRLDQLLEPGSWRSFEVRSATGYARRLPIGDLDRTYLALRLGGEPLSSDHGYPARLVAPGRRGFWWVKWVVSVQPSMQPWWVQSPFPVT